MYRIKGADGQEYGPVSTEQLRQWIAEGRVNALTPVRAEGAADWKTAADFPELGLMRPPAPSTAFPMAAPVGVRGDDQTLAITSFVLGLLSLVCFSVFAGVPAIICGHIAYSRTRRAPAYYGGAGFAIAGLITGYLSIAFAVLILPALLLPALSQAKGRAQSINCVNNMKQLGLAFKVWALDNNDQFPFNVSTNTGGTFELCSVGADGFDKNVALHFGVMSNELSTPKILVCPGDSSKQPAFDFTHLHAINVSYQLHSGTNLNDSNPTAVLAVCPIHGHILRCDGSVEQKGRRRRWGD